jgi:2-desacetyl-2-hydroxyethyl bacteriochlorophyllide A dehydrogenase
MRAVTFAAPGQVALAELAEPRLEAPTDALVQIRLAAICGSDLHLYHGRVPTIPGSSLGHEFVGTVVAVGEAVSALKLGERVVGSFHVACGTCRACRRGEYHLCATRAVYGYGPLLGNLPGAQAELLRVPHADVNLRALPEALSDARAIFAGDILTTAFGGLVQGGLAPGERVAILGAGPVGLMAVMAAWVLGAAQVFALDRVPERLERAQELGAIPIDVGYENPKRRLAQLTDDEGADLVIEAVGGEATVGLALELARAGGRVVALGVTSAQSFAFPLSSALMRDLSFRIGLANIHRHIDRVLALLAAGRLVPEAIVSHRLPLAEAAEGYRLFDSKAALKVLLEVPGV